MRVTLKKSISISLLLVCGLAMQSCSACEGMGSLPPKNIAKATDKGVSSAINSQCGDDSLPPEVKALIGKKLPPKIAGISPSEIPNFIEANGALLVDSGDTAISVLAYSEGVLAQKWPVFFMVRIYHPSRETEILDARILPANLLDWRLKNGVVEENSGHYKLSGRCRANKEDARIILGLVRTERGKEGCSHFSRRIKQAWQMDVKSGSLALVATQGLQCEYITMNDCY